jgi:hypothetical protein
MNALFCVACTLLQSVSTYNTMVSLAFEALYFIFTPKKKDTVQINKMNFVTKSSITHQAESINGPIKIK